MAEQPTTKDLKRQGICESCSEPAFSIRHDEGIELYHDANGELRSRSFAIEHPMCVWHKAKYIQHMEAEKKALEAKKRGKRTSDV